MPSVDRLLAEYKSVTKLEEELRIGAEDAAKRRSSLVNQMHGTGLSYAKIGDLIGLHASRAYQLATRGK